MSATATHERVRAACCNEFSGLPPQELEQHARNVTARVLHVRPETQEPAELVLDDALLDRLQTRGA